MKKRSEKIIHIVFIALVGALLLSALGRAVLWPKTVVPYENRTAEKFPAFSPSSFASAEYQEGLEAALADQVPLAESAKKLYNRLETEASLAVLRPVFEAEPERYHAFNGLRVYGAEWLVYSPSELNEEERTALTKRADSINALADSHPDIDFFAYYVKKDNDLNFETGEHMESYDYLAGALAKGRCAISRLATETFEDYSACFYKTDHHWNHEGAYRAYLDLLTLLGVEDEPIVAGEVFTVRADMSGSKASTTKTAGVWTEEMLAYTFDFPAMTITANGEEMEDYGFQNTSAADAEYGTYYGGPYGDLVFDRSAPERDNLLVIGDSYDNAVLKLLASHYNKTFSVDLRHTDTFDFASFTAENDIDQVLFLGSNGFYVSDEFEVR